MHFIRLIRPANLLMILFIQYMIRFAFFSPIFRYEAFTLQLPESIFALLAFSFVFIAAGGYIINDYYDIEIDKINKPGKLIIGDKIKPGTAFISYCILSAIGLIMACLACYKGGLPQLTIVFFIYLSGLWFYSNTLKYYPFIGNVIIALFVGLVPLISGVMELYADIKTPAFHHTDINISSLFYWILGISFFAFSATLVREITKDVEDMEGDLAAGCRTVPIVMGKTAAQRISQFVLLIMFFLLGFMQYQQCKVRDWASFIYFTFFLQIPILFLINRIHIATEKDEFHKISTWLKILMVSGICYLFVFAYNIFH